MNGVVLLLALAVPSVDYGWRVNDGGDVECIVQLEPELLSAILKGDAPHALVRDNAPRQNRRARFLLQIGDDTLPRELNAPALVEPARYRVEQTTFPNAHFAPHGWRLLEDGGAECVIHIAPKLAEAVIQGEASAELTGDALPVSDRPVRFVVFVTDDPLPYGVVDLTRLSELEAAAQPRLMQLSHAEPAIAGSGRTVFETQLQLRRGEADTRFESTDSTASNRTQPSNTGSNRYGAGARSPAGGSLSDSSSRYGATATSDYGSRFGSQPAVYAPPARDDDGGLQIRFGDGETGGAGPAIESPLAPRVPERSPYTETNPSRFASESSRFAAGAGGLSPKAPPLTDPGYGSVSRDRQEPPRTALGPTSGSSASPPESTRREPPPAYAAPGAGYGPEGAGYGAPPRGPAYAAGGGAPPYNYPPAGGYGPGGAADSADPRLASRGGYAGPFGSGFGVDATAAAAAAAALAREKEKEEADAKSEKDLDKKTKEVAEAEPQWMPLVMTMMALLASLSGNAYLGHMAYGFYRRYREMTDEMRSAPNFASSSLDEDEERSSGSGRRSRRRGRLARSF